MNIHHTTSDKENCKDKEPKQQLNFEENVEEVLEDSYESFSCHVKQKHTKRHDKHHVLDDSDPFEEKHHKKRDSGKRRHRTKSKEIKPDDDLDAI